MTALHHAGKEGRLEVVKCLADAGADKEAKDKVRGESLGSPVYSDVLCGCVAQ